MLTREGKDWTHRYPFLAERLEGLGLDRTILDGEVVWLNPEGHSDFQGLQTALREERHDELVYYVFDLLYLNGRSLLKLPLATRKERLKELLSPLSSNGPIRFSDHIVGQGEDLFETSCRLKLEGIVSKRADRPYKHGRSDDWLKSKCVNRQELVIGGYTEPQGARKHFGALLLGAHDREGRLRFVGKAGTGFTSKTLKELISRMKPLETREPPFMNPPTEPGVHWVQPSLVAEVNLASWTHHGNVRQASFQGLREDKPAEKVVYESPKHLEDIVQPKAPAKTKSKRSLAAEVTGSKPRSKSRRLPEPPALELTSPDKILFEDVGLTKLELAEYYDFVAPWMVPYLKDRPLTLLRCPDGRHHQCFIQRHASKNMDEDIEVFTLKGKAAGPHMKISSADGLTALVQLGTLEIHCWAGRQPNLKSPDQMIFDLDPAEDVNWSDVVDCAHDLRALLDELGLQSFAKLSGGKGVHLHVPLAPRYDWDQVREFARAASVLLEERMPDKVLTNMSKSKRKGKIFIDYLRNAYSASAVSPYSTRSKPGVPVAMPIHWDELTVRVKPNEFTIKKAVARLKRQRRDPWAGMLGLSQELSVFQ